MAIITKKIIPQVYNLNYGRSYIYITVWGWHGACPPLKKQSKFHGSQNVLPNTKPYKKIIDSMYRKMNPQFRGLVAEILQDAEPRGTEDTQADKRDNIISNTLKGYSSAVDRPVNDIDFSTGRSSDDKKLNS